MITVVYSRLGRMWILPDPVTVHVFRPRFINDNGHTWYTVVVRMILQRNVNLNPSTKWIARRIIPFKNMQHLGAHRLYWLRGALATLLSPRRPSALAYSPSIALLTSLFTFNTLNLSSGKISLRGSQKTESLSKVFHPLCYGGSIVRWSWGRQARVIRCHR